MLKGAIIGFGNIASLGHGPTYQTLPDIQVVAVVDPSAQRLEVARHYFPAAQIHTSIDELWSLSEPLDFIDICTPPSTHVPLAAQALEHGYHVLCEKPLALQEADVTQLAKTAARAKRTLFTVHNWKYAPIYQKAFEWIASGKLGTVWKAQIQTLRHSHCKGTSDGSAGRSNKKPEDWRLNPAVAGGGILIDHGWHSFYLLMNLIQQEPLTDQVSVEKPAMSDALEEEAFCRIRFTGGAQGEIFLTWRSTQRRCQAMVWGEKGSLLLDENRLVFTPHNGMIEEWVSSEGLSAGSHHADWFRPLFADFLKEIRDPAERGKNLQEARWCARLTERAYDYSSGASCKS